MRFRLYRWSTPIFCAFSASLVFSKGSHLCITKWDAGSGKFGCPCSVRTRISLSRQGQLGIVNQWMALNQYISSYRTKKIFSANRGTNGSQCGVTSMLLYIRGRNVVCKPFRTSRASRFRHSESQTKEDSTTFDHKLTAKLRSRKWLGCGKLGNFGKRWLAASSIVVWTLFSDSSSGSTSQQKFKHNTTPATLGLPRETSGGPGEKGWSGGGAEIYARMLRGSYYLEMVSARYKSAVMWTLYCQFWFTAIYFDYQEM